MIMRPRINSKNESNLFTIETNTTFPLRHVKKSADFATVAAAFGEFKVGAVFEVIKPSPSSVLYQIDCGTDSLLMLRGSAAEKAPALNGQCIATNLLSESMCIRPLPTKDRAGYTFHLNDKIWIAYRHLIGEIYDGKNFQLDCLLGKIYSLESELAQIGRNLPTNVSSLVPQLNYCSDAWPKLVEHLYSDKTKQINYRLGNTSKALLRDNFSWIRELAIRNANTQMSTDAALVHNDINHANILIGQCGISFLDIEDIIFCVPEVSVAHAIFKLLRHRVHCNYASVAETQREIDRILKRLENERWNLKSRTLLFDYAARRVISDINFIYKSVIETGNSRFLYDLEKKIHNLFELWKILEPPHELATR